MKNTTFSVGFGRRNLTGPLPASTWYGNFERYRDPLMLTCIAFSDGEKTALVMSADIMKIDGTAFEECAKRLNEKFGILRQDVMIGATHSHYAPTITATSSWASEFYTKMLEAVEEAILDLTPARAFSGKGYTDSLNFVRRYLMPDGSYRMNASPKDNPVAHESEADNELRSFRFEREGKKDVLMANYQSHYHGIPEKEHLSADVFGEFRKLAEAELDCLFIYCSGASGNLNFSSPMPGEGKRSLEQTAIELVRATKEAIASETEAKTGEIITATAIQKGYIRHDTEERVRQAKEICDLGRDTPEAAVLIRKYQFVNKYEASSVVYRSHLGETLDLPFFAITCGDLAFSSAPFEQFDTNAQEVRAASPFPATFTLSMINESHAYVPSALADYHTSYEVATSKFVPGSGQIFAEQQIKLLKECKQKA